MPQIRPDITHFIERFTFSTIFATMRSMMELDICKHIQGLRYYLQSLAAEINIHLRFSILRTSSMVELIFVGRYSRF